MVPAASILIVNYNSGPHLRACLESLKAQTVAEFEVFILDNGSNDNSIDLASMVVGADSRFHFLLGTQNFGFADGNNRAAKHARAKWIVTLNPDAFPKSDWLARLLTATEANPNVVHFGSTQIMADNDARLDGAGDRYFAAGIPWRDRTTARVEAANALGQNTFETFSACAAAAMYRADVFAQIGGFDARFFCFIEDVDLGFRLRLRGHKCLQVIDARVAHVGGGAGGGTSDFARYHGTRNLIWCFAKNVPVPLLVILAPGLLAVLTTLLIKAFGRGDAKTIIRAIRDGISGIGTFWQDRQRAAHERTASLGDIAFAMDWNPLAYIRGRRG